MASEIVDVDQARSENEDAYDAFLQGDRQQLRGAILNDALRDIGPSQPVLCKSGTTVREAIGLLAGKHQGAVLVVDDEGKLIGIFSERDVLYRVVGSDKDVNTTTVGEVMTRDPVALSAGSKIADALNVMSVRGFRNIPIVKEGKPIGIVFTQHFVKFIVSLFPENTVNRGSSSGRILNPDTMHSG
ncbi:MAG: CBS domain-containing protein [Planctomycetota bacterium]|jgi:CBS domain-containing protein